MGYLLLSVIVFASLLIVDYLARKRGWNRNRWGLWALTIGPLAIPMVYLVDAAIALKRMMIKAAGP